MKTTLVGGKSGGGNPGGGNPVTTGNPGRGNPVSMAVVEVHET